MSNFICKIFGHKYIQSDLYPNIIRDTDLLTVNAIELSIIFKKSFHKKRICKRCKKRQVSLNYISFNEDFVDDELTVEELREEKLKKLLS